MNKKSLKAPIEEASESALFCFGFLFVFGFFFFQGASELKCLVSPGVLQQAEVFCLFVLML